MQLFNKVIDYYKKASWGKRISDLLFYALLIAILIPSSRRWLMEHTQRLVMLSPAEKKVARPLTDADWQWFVVDCSGKKHYLSEFRGKVIFINFWATWCGPCLAEMPALQEFYDHFRSDTGIVFLFVTDEDFSQTKTFMQKRGYNLPVYRMIFSPYGVLRHSSIPSTYLIDRRGRIVVEAHRSKKWNSSKVYRIVDKLISEKP